MTWVSDEPWGYVTHHYGRWGWTLSLGWYWIPGIHFSPAWVAWQNSDVYFGWAPLGYYDAPCTWGYGEWNGGYCWNVVSINFIWAPGIHHRMHHGWRNLRDFGPRGDRPLSPPWHRTPLIVRPGEIRDPNQFRRLVQQRDLRRERLLDYSRRSEQATGRKVYRFAARDAQAAPRPGTPVGRPQSPRGFLERERQWRRSERPDARRVPEGGVAPRREQPRGQEEDRPGRRTEPVQPRQNPGEVVVPRREQPRGQEGDRPVRRTEPVQPQRNSGDVARPQRVQTPRGSAEQREARPSVERPAAVKESPAQVKESRPNRDRREERSKDNR